MTNRDDFYIRHVQGIHIGTENKCPVCGDSFTAKHLAVHDNYGQPICELCAWEQAMTLAGLLYFSDVAGAFYHSERPPHIVDGIEHRQNDPRRLEKELLDALDWIEAPRYGNDGALMASPLKKFVAGKIRAALKSKSTETMKKARDLVEESQRGMSGGSTLDDEIPF